MERLKRAVSETIRQFNPFKKEHNKMNTTFKKKTGVVLFIIFAIFCGLHFVFNNALTANAEIALTASADGVVTPSAALTMNPYSYIQDFEGEDPFKLWTSNGTYTVNYKGVTTKRASSGKQSFKIDITFGTATYIYWMIPIKVPSINKLDFKGDIYIESVNGGLACLGTNLSITPAPYSGVNTLKAERSVSTKWITQTSDLVSKSTTIVQSLVNKYCSGASPNDVGAWTDIIGLFLYGKQGATITLFIDNITLTGVVPDINQYSALIQSRWLSYKDRSLKELKENQKILQEQGILLEDVFSSAIKRGYPQPNEINIINSKLEEIKHDNIIIYPCNPLSNQKILPDTYLSVPSGNSISIQACQGEFEPASFVIRALKDLSGINISLTNLTGDNGNIIDSNNLDISLVKVWYQASANSIHNEGVRVLIPELLLHDDSLVKVDTVFQKNYLKVKVNGVPEYIDISSSTSKVPEGALVEDSEKLLPFDLNANTNKQIFITVHIPEYTKSGAYKGNISISNGENKLGTVEIKVNVLPFKLETPILDYGLYYRGTLTKKNITTISVDYKTPEQYRIELNDMKSHGVRYPTLYQPRGDLDLFKQYLLIRDEVGLPKDKIYILATNTNIGNSTDPAILKSFEVGIGKWVVLLKEHGYEEVFIYGIDEATGDRLLSQRKAWETTHKAGAKIFAANSVGTAELVGDILDLAVTSAGSNVEEVEKWKSHNKRVFSYANPQVGVENPEIYRKNYGLGLICNGYDGTMNYAYQDAFNDIWNDFDHDKYRDHVFSYPTSNGVIRTIAWEGFREGVDDVRYLSTLIKKDNAILNDMVNKIKPLLLNNESLDTLRTDIVNQILSK